MVRIIQDENESPEQILPELKAPELGYPHQVLLKVIGLVVAQAPSSVKELLEDYSIELSRDFPEEELIEKLIYAIGECDEDFNRDLASLILDNTLESSYDQYDFKKLAGQTANVLVNMSGNQSEGRQNAPGILGGITSTIGQIGGAIGRGIQTVQSRSASEQARAGINAYRRQMAERQRAEEKKKNELFLLLFLTALGIGILGFTAYIKRQGQPIIKPS